MMHSKVFFLYFLFISVMISFLASCGSLAPFAEQARAMRFLEKALSIEANIYSEENFFRARKNFDTGESLIITNEKSKANDEAKLKYLLSIEASKMAYSNAINPFIKKLLDVTATRLLAAREEKVDIASSKLYMEAFSLNEAAKEHFRIYNYSNARVSTLEARKVLEGAIEETRVLKAAVMKKALIFELLLKKIKGIKGMNAVPIKYEGVIEMNKSIRNEVKEGKYGGSLGKYDILIKESEDLIMEIEEKRRIAREEISSSEELLELAKKRNEEIEEEVKDLNNPHKIEDYK